MISPKISLPRNNDSANDIPLAKNDIAKDIYREIMIAPMISHQQRMILPKISLPRNNDSANDIPPGKE